MNYKSNKLLVGVIAILLGVVVYQGIRIRDQSFRLANLRQRLESAALRVASVRLEGEKSPTLEAIATVTESPQLQRRNDSSQTREAASISERVEALKDSLQRLPEQRIPQLAYATDADWYAAVDGELETPEDFRMALARIRAAAEGRFAKLLMPALQAYLHANDGVFPEESARLQPFFDQSVDPAALQHYKVVRAETVGNVRVGGEWAMTQAALVDSKYDSHVVIGPNGFGTYGHSK